MFIVSNFNWDIAPQYPQNKKEPHKSVTPLNFIVRRTLLGLAV